MLSRSGRAQKNCKTPRSNSLVRGLSPLPPAARRTIKFLIFGRDLFACWRRFEKEERQLRLLLCHVAHVRDKCRTKHVLPQLGESYRVSRRLHGFYRRSYVQIVNFQQKSEKKREKMTPSLPSRSTHSNRSLTLPHGCGGLRSPLTSPPMYIPSGCGRRYIYSVRRCSYSSGRRNTYSVRRSSYFAGRRYIYSVRRCSYSSGRRYIYSVRRSSYSSDRRNIYSVRRCSYSSGRRNIYAVFVLRRQVVYIFRQALYVLRLQAVYIFRQAAFVLFRQAVYIFRQSVFVLRR